MTEKEEGQYFPRLSPEEPISSAVFLDMMFKNHGIDLSSPDRQLVFHWRKLCPENIAAHSRPEYVKDGFLQVLCDSGSTAQLTRLSAGEIIKNINLFLPELKVVKIKTRVGFLQSH